REGNILRIRGQDDAASGATGVRVRPEAATAAGGGGGSSGLAWGMRGSRLYRCLFAALLLCPAAALAQITVEPEGVAVTVEQYQAETRTVTLTNTGGEPLTFCLSFERPLEEGPE